MRATAEFCDEESMLEAVRDAVSRAAGTPKHELPILYDVVSADALVELLVGDPGSPRSAIAVHFEMADCLITAFSKGKVIAEESVEVGHLEGEYEHDDRVSRIGRREGRPHESGPDRL